MIRWPLVPPKHRSWREYGLRQQPAPDGQLVPDPATAPDNVKRAWVGAQAGVIGGSRVYWRIDNPPTQPPQAQDPQIVWSNNG